MNVNDAAEAAGDNVSSALERPEVVAAVKDYLAELEAGRRPRRGEFLRKYPDIADSLARCLEGLEYIHAAAPDLSAASTLAPQAHELSEPLGDFRIIRELGHGGMGIVYEAEQMSLGRRVALKVLPFAATLDSRHLHRFKNEALAAATLDHPHIVDVYGVGADRGVHYYAMRLIDGQTLAEVIAPNSPRYQNDLAIVLIKTNQLDEALVAAREAVRRSAGSQWIRKGGKRVDSTRTG